MSGTQSHADQNRELVIKVYEAVQKADAATFFSLCDPGVVIHEAPSMKVGGVYRGVEELGGLLGQIASQFDMSTLEIERVVADAEFAVAMVSFQTTDHSYRVRVSEWWQIRDGKIVEVRPYYWDTQELNQALA